MVGRRVPRRVDHHVARLIGMPQQLGANRIGYLGAGRENSCDFDERCGIDGGEEAEGEGFESLHRLAVPRGSGDEHLSADAQKRRPRIAARCRRVQPGP